MREKVGISSIGGEGIWKRREKMVVGGGVVKRQKIKK